MTAPTEAEIREAVQEALDASTIDISEWVFEMSTPILYIPPAERLNGNRGALWDDLRPSQAAYLTALQEAIDGEAQAIEKEVTDRLAEAIVRAALDFASTFPDAPRAVREPVTA